MPLFITNALDGQPLPVYGDGRQRASGCTSTTTAPGSSSCSARRRRARSTTSAARSARTWTSPPHPRADRRRARPRPPRDDRPGHDRRYAVDTSKLRALGWTPSHSFESGGSPRPSSGIASNRAWWEPIKSGEYRGTTRAVRRVSPLSANQAARLPRLEAKQGGSMPAAPPASSRLFALARVAFAAARPHRRSDDAGTDSTDRRRDVISGHGFGHGIGMSQYGAYGYAQHGWTTTRSWRTTTRARPSAAHRRSPSACCSRRARRDSRLGRGAVQAHRRLEDASDAAGRHAPCPARTNPAGGRSAPLHVDARDRSRSSSAPPATAARWSSAPMAGSSRS